MKKIILASNNAGKLAELTDAISDYGYDVRAQKEYGVNDADETGLSFVENAIIKARHACEHTGLPSLADDSGLEIDALNGAPGIFSARYSGLGASDQDNTQRVLDALRGVPNEARSARYHCALVFMRNKEDPTPIIAEGSWEGRILDAPRGSNGFGYDPIFWLPDLACSAAELSKDKKSALSHRAQALKTLARRLNEMHSQTVST